MKCIAIVGAGWAGVGVLRILREKGFKVDLYEQKNDVGGVWHPDNSYVGLKIHMPASMVEYFDFPLPDNIDKTERMMGKQVYDYMRSYCLAKNLYDNMRFNVSVDKISYSSLENKSTLLITSINDGTTTSQEYDYVVYTNGYANRPIPNFLGKESFAGSIYHSFDINLKLFHSIISSNKRVVLLGASKAATDLILSFSEYAYKLTWLYREAYWFYRYHQFRNLAQKTLAGRRKSFFLKLTIFFVIGLSKFPVLSFHMTKWFKAIHTYGSRRQRGNHKKFHAGIIDATEMDSLKEYNRRYGIQGEIARLEGNKIYLEDGKILETDVLICCTGSGVNKTPLIDVELDGKKFSINEVTNVYKSRIIPDVPNLIFTAYHRFSVGTSSGLNEGNWIAKYIEFNPPKKYLLDNSNQFKRPFFVDCSDDYSSNEFLNSTEPFYLSGELSKKKYVEYFLHENLCNSGGTKPLEFEMPKTS